jgi:hypothetical protein
MRTPGYRIKEYLSIIKDGGLTFTICLYFEPVVLRPGRNSGRRGDPFKFSFDLPT